ncbi:MAG: preprotein translocase subunit SecG [Sulfurovum sp. FS06-10]|jgi:preprotein translocase subunit SecG|nr:MAG: preprotein translocase subunit SecG [Sulfurovum sp. FS06-10]
MTSTLLVVQIALTIAIVIAILLQKSSSIGLGAYSGSNESMFGAKGPAGFLSKATFTLAILFVLNTLVMGYLYNKEKTHSVADTINTSTSVPTATVVESNTSTK